MAKKRFQFSNIWGVLKESGSEWVEDKAPKMSGALAYYTVIAIAPLIIITMKIVSVIFRGKDTSQLLHNQISSLTGPQMAKLTDAINSVKQSGSGVVATVISIAVALLGASGVFGELQDSLNTIWGVRPKPNRGIMGMLQDRFLSMSMVLGIAFLLLVSMFVSTTIAGLSGSTMHRLLGGNGAVNKDLLFCVNVVLSIVVITLLFAAMFRYLPDVKISWSDVWLGAFVTSILFEVGKASLTVYFRYESPDSTYGAAGSLVAALLWIYYSAYILFFGAEFTQVYANQFGSHIVPASNAEPLTEEMRARQGIPHTEASADQPSPGKPGDAAAGGSQGTSPRRTAGSRGLTARQASSSRPRPGRSPGPRKASRPPRPLGPPPKSYAGRFVPVLAAAVVARFVYKRVEAHRLLHPTPATLATPSRWQQYAKIARGWATRRAMAAALKLSETTTGRAVLRAGLKSKLLRV